MKKNLVELVFILDRSGSMAGLEKDTIGGFNAMIEKQKKVEGEAIVSTILFDNQFEVLHNRANIKELKPMTTNDYYVRGSTALLDAIGRSITKIGYTHKHLELDEVPEKTVFVITTDGHENASDEYTQNQVKKMIERQELIYNWEFIFLGANIDAVQTAKMYGIREERTANYHADHEGTVLNYETIGEAIKELRVKKSISDSWKDEIDMDYINRKNKK